MTRECTPNFKEPRAPKKPVKKRKPRSAQSKADELWGAVVHLRDNGCRFCGKTEGKMDAHHVLLRRFKATRCDPGNGLLLCFQCHQNVAHGDPFAAVLEYERIFGHDGYQSLRDKAAAGVGAKYPEAFWRERVASLEALLVELGLRYGTGEK